MESERGEFEAKKEEEEGEKKREEERGWMKDKAAACQGYTVKTQKDARVTVAFFTL